MGIKFVGVDDGHYAVKIVREDGSFCSAPSRAQHGKQLTTLTGKEDSEAFYEVSDSGEIFTVSEYLPSPDNTRFSAFPKSALNLVLVHHALRTAGYGGSEVSIVSGLPVSSYFIGSREINTKLVEAKQKNLARPVLCGEKAMATIKKNNVVAEAIAAYIDSFFDMKGNVTEHGEKLKTSFVGVIDIGGKTTDCAVIMPGAQAIDSSRLGSSDIGMLDLHDAVNARIRSEHEFNLPPSTLEQTVRSGKLMAGGVEINVAKIISEELDNLAKRVYSAIQPILQNGMDLPFILLVGGGAHLLEPHMRKHYPHLMVPKDPEYANARGMFKAAKYIFG